MTLAGQSGENFAAVIVLLEVYAFGAAKRKIPSGGCAYGMPRYSETCGCQLEEWPTTLPEVVLTGWPTLKAGATCGNAAVRLANESSAKAMISTECGEEEYQRKRNWYDAMHWSVIWSRTINYDIVVNVRYTSNKLFQIAEAL
jgi:hypothetical protein